MCETVPITCVHACKHTRVLGHVQNILLTADNGQNGRKSGASAGRGDPEARLCRRQADHGDSHASSAAQQGQVGPVLGPCPPPPSDTHAHVPRPPQLPVRPPEGCGWLRQGAGPAEGQAGSPVFAGLGGLPGAGTEGRFRRPRLPGKEFWRILPEGPGTDRGEETEAGVNGTTPREPGL